MQFSKNTSFGVNIVFLVKVILVLVIFIGAIAMLGKIDFPSPSNKIEKIIQNEKLKIVK